MSSIRKYVDGAPANPSSLRNALMEIDRHLDAIQSSANYQLNLGVTDESPNRVTAISLAPAAPQISVVGVDGKFEISVVLPQQIRPLTTAQKANATRDVNQLNPATAGCFVQIQSALDVKFSVPTTYGPTPAIHLQLQIPNQTLFWRARASYDQSNYGAWGYNGGGAVASGALRSTSQVANAPLNQSNFANIASYANGSSTIVKVFGSGGLDSNWPHVVGITRPIYPGATLIGVASSSDFFVAYDPMAKQYHLLSQLPDSFPDTWIPVGKVSTVGLGVFKLPTAVPILSGGGLVGGRITDPGSGLTALSVQVTDSGGGSGGVLTAVIQHGLLTQLVPGNAGNNYTGATAIGFTSLSPILGQGTGGGGPTGGNGGRIYGVTQ